MRTTITITVKFEGRIAYIRLSDGTEWTKELPDGQTEEQFAAEIETLARKTLGDKIRKVTTTKVMA